MLPGERAEPFGAPGRRRSCGRRSGVGHAEVALPATPSTSFPPDRPRPGAGAHAAGRRRRPPDAPFMGQGLCRACAMPQRRLEARPRARTRDGHARRLYRRRAQLQHGIGAVGRAGEGDLLSDEAAGARATAAARRGGPPPVECRSAPRSVVHEGAARRCPTARPLSPGTTATAADCWKMSPVRLRPSTPRADPRRWSASRSSRLELEPRSSRSTRRGGRPAGSHAWLGANALTRSARAPDFYVFGSAAAPADIARARRRPARAR